MNGNEQANEEQPHSPVQEPLVPPELQGAAAADPANPLPQPQPPPQPYVEGLLEYPVETSAKGHNRHRPVVCELDEQNKPQECTYVLTPAARSLIEQLQSNYPPEFRPRPGVNSDDIHLDDRIRPRRRPSLLFQQVPWVDDPTSYVPVSVWKTQLRKYNREADINSAPLAANCGVTYHPRPPDPNCIPTRRGRTRKDRLTGFRFNVDNVVPYRDEWTNWDVPRGSSTLIGPVSEASRLLVPRPPSPPTPFDDDPWENWEEEVDIQDLINGTPFRHPSRPYTLFENIARAQRANEELNREEFRRIARERRDPERGFVPIHPRSANPSSTPWRRNPGPRRAPRERSPLHPHLRGPRNNNRPINIPRPTPQLQFRPDESDPRSYQEQYTAQYRHSLNRARHPSRETNSRHSRNRTPPNNRVPEGLEVEVLQRLDPEIPGLSLTFNSEINMPSDAIAEPAPMEEDRTLTDPEGQLNPEEPVDIEEDQGNETSAHPTPLQELNPLSYQLTAGQKNTRISGDNAYQKVNRTQLILQDVGAVNDDYTDPRSYPQEPRPTLNINTHFHVPVPTEARHAHHMIGCLVLGCPGEFDPMKGGREIANHWIRRHLKRVPCYACMFCGAMYIVNSIQNLFAHIQALHRDNPHPTEVLKSMYRFNNPMANRNYVPVYYFLNNQYIDPHGVKPPSYTPFGSYLQSIENASPGLLYQHRRTLNRWATTSDVVNMTHQYPRMSKDATTIQPIQIPNHNPSEGDYELVDDPHCHLYSGHQPQLLTPNATRANVIFTHMIDPPERDNTRRRATSANVPNQMDTNDTSYEQSDNSNMARLQREIHRVRAIPEPSCRSDQERVRVIPQPSCRSADQTPILQRATNPGFFAAPPTITRRYNTRSHASHTQGINPNPSPESILIASDSDSSITANTEAKRFRGHSPEHPASRENNLSHSRPRSSTGGNKSGSRSSRGRGRGRGSSQSNTQRTTTVTTPTVGHGNQVVTTVEKSSQAIAPNLNPESMNIVSETTEEYSIAKTVSFAPDNLGNEPGQITQSPILSLETVASATPRNEYHLRQVEANRVTNADDTIWTPNPVPRNASRNPSRDDITPRTYPGLAREIDTARLINLPMEDDSTQVQVPAALHGVVKPRPACDPTTGRQLDPGDHIRPHTSRLEGSEERPPEPLRDGTVILTPTFFMDGNDRIEQTVVSSNIQFLTDHLDHSLIAAPGDRLVQIPTARLTVPYAPTPIRTQNTPITPAEVTKTMSASLRNADILEGMLQHGLRQIDYVRVGILTPYNRIVQLEQQSQELSDALTNAQNDLAVQQEACEGHVDTLREANETDQIVQDEIRELKLELIQVKGIVTILTQDLDGTRHELVNLQENAHSQLQDEDAQRDRLEAEIAIRIQSFADKAARDERELHTMDAYQEKQQNELLSTNNLLRQTKELAAARVKVADTKTEQSLAVQAEMEIECKKQTTVIKHMWKQGQDRNALILSLRREKQELSQRNSDLQKELDTTKARLLDAQSQSASLPGMDPPNLNPANDLPAFPDDLQEDITQEYIEEMIRKMDSDKP